MKTNIYKTVLAMAVLGAVGCDDKWNEHYTDHAEACGTANAYELILNDPELSNFAQMVEIAGYAELLQSTQTFTVWAPVNSALAGVDMTDKTAVTRTVVNHIARFNISSATKADEGVKMMNGKLLYFAEGGKLSFGGADIIEADLHAKNGIVHKLAAVIPYAYNLREYIDTHSNTTSISAFLARYDQMLRPGDIPGATSSTAADSTLVSYNRLLEYPNYGLGSIASEDSVFAMVIPDDNAWSVAYEAIKPYFVTYDADPAVADSLQDLQTSLAIVKDLVFRTGLKDPATMDSIVSTSGSVISNPARFLDGMTSLTASNGRIYLAPALNYDMTETFNKKIHIEAEEQNGRTPAAGTTVYTRNVATDNPLAGQVSGQRYLEVFPVAASRQPGISFAVEDVLAGAYDIYASFVPANITDATNTSDSTRVQFVITYMDANGRSKTSSFNSKEFVTSGTEMTTIKFAEGFKFPVANYYDRLWYTDPKNDPKDRKTTTSIYISTNVSNSEFNTNVLSRRFRLDRLYLVPVKAE